MKTKLIAAGIIGALFLLMTTMLVPEGVRAHCDTLEGPVVQDARTALESGDITPVLKWVRTDDEKAIRAAFAQTLTARSKGPEARELADLYFFETLVRIHRAGEGAPYTGLKSADTVDAAVVMADQALEAGNVDHLIKVLTGAMAEAIRARFQETLESRKQVNDSVEAGRAFVERYVVFTHYVEGLHGLIRGGTAHHGAEENQNAADSGH